MKLSLSSLMLVMFVSCPLFANPAQRDGRMDRQGPPQRPCFSVLDSNGDGYISLQEFSAQPHPQANAEDLFSQIDADANGQISQSEFDGFKPPFGPSMTLLDSNGDGQISYSEFSAVPVPHGDTQTIFNSIDTDGSNSISQAELDAHKQEKRQDNNNNSEKKGRCHD